MRKDLGRVCVALTVTAALLAGAVAPAAAAVPARLPAAVADLHEMGISGVQGLTLVDGRTAVARAGFGDLERRTPVPPNGHFRIGSNTKTFVSVVVLQLVGEGRL
ncbi:MAG TPA: serine hydrolase domain-containing protein, partial [Actinoplanes sp.]